MKNNRTADNKATNTSNVRLLFILSYFYDAKVSGSIYTGVGDERKNAVKEECNHE